MSTIEWTVIAALVAAFSIWAVAIVLAVRESRAVPHWPPAGSRVPIPPGCAIGTVTTDTYVASLADPACQVSQTK